MIRARVIGEVWATRKAPALGGRRLTLCAVCDAGADADRVVVAVDTLDADAGQDVLVSFGSGARNVLRPGPDNRDILCDAAVSLLVDGAG